MMQILQRSRDACSLILVVAATTVVSACGVNSSGQDKGPQKNGPSSDIDVSTVKVDPKAKALLPASVASSGTLKVASELDWPPFTYKGSNGRPTGIDIRLIEAVGRKLGLKVTIADLGATTIIPSIQNGRFDVAVSQLVTTPDRRAVVNFVDYIKNSLGLVVRKDGAADISPTNLCGHTLVATQGTGPLSFGREYSKDECVGKGKPAIKFEVFPDSASTILALANRRGDGFLSNKAVGVYLAQTANRGLVMANGEMPGSVTRSGIAYSKQDDQLGKAVKAALLSLMDDGFYQKILGQWGIGDQALTKAEIQSEASS